MQYDFKKLQQAFVESGMTLAELAEKSDLETSTISKAFRRGTAHQKTARKLTDVLKVPMKSIVVVNQRKTA